ncbi:MAG: shikimate dehydrogenase [Kofleriaceae bacterium]|nr:shikimate dehydrogenase [Kofleriaceae bacterium]
MSADAIAPRVGVVLGWPVAHSRSPAMHNAAFAAAGVDAVFGACAVPPARLAAAVRGLAAADILGASVTVPHKQAVIALCDRLAPPADRIGAVNCLVFERDGDEVTIVGHNTDAGGFVDALGAAAIACAGARVVVLGAGGAARAVHAGLADAGAASLTVIARRPEAVTWIDARPWRDAELRDALATADLLVDCTSSALDAATEPAVVDGVPLDALPAAAVVASLVYHREPLLLARARGRGHRVVDGRGMLAHQGARAFTLWLGRPAPVDVMLTAI